jgi:hypothetical protein
MDFGALAVRDVNMGRWMIVRSVRRVRDEMKGGILGVM